MCLFSIFDFRSDLRQKAPGNRNLEILVRSSSSAPGSPWRVWLPSSDGTPGTNGATCKDSLRTGNEHEVERFASAAAPARSAARLNRLPPPHSRAHCDRRVVSENA